MFVRDRMTPTPITLQLDSDYKSALALMKERAIHHLPVLDGERRLAGIIAERDLLLAAYHYLGADVDIDEVMHRDVVTAKPEMPLADAALLMVEHAIGCLPVVDGGGQVVGVITETDIFRTFVSGERRGNDGPAAATPAKGVPLGKSPTSARAGRQPAAKKMAGKPSSGKGAATVPAAGKAPRAARPRGRS
jgi:acetoin utilization protein AcuB